MSVKKSNPLSTIFGIIVLVAVIGVLYYGLVLCTQAGPAAEEVADRAKLRLTTENIWDISNIPYELFSDDFQAVITKTEYEEVMKQTAPTQKTIDLFQKIDKVEGGAQFLQGAATYYCGSVENPVKGKMKIQGIEYEVTHAVEFAPNVENFEPEIINWTITIERLTRA
ncbi:MAG: hypothetical protein IKK53_03675 [Ruminiclostridium sp.]|nr:hypothetical protein [Ruminiclostridium sp.]